MAETQAVYYRDMSGVEPVNDFIESLPAKRAAKIDDYVEQHMNGRPPDSPRRTFRSRRRSMKSCASYASDSPTRATGCSTSAPTIWCWPVRTLDDFKLAPFHVLASDGHVHVDKPHTWHMEIADELARDDALFKQTRWHVVDTTDSDSQKAGTAWWESMTGAGGEGMVMKPLEFIATGRRGLTQPALKTRGREYLRIIYGPEYTEPQNLERLRERGLGRKRSLTEREFALGLEGLERFVRGEPLRRVHECVFWRTGPRKRTGRPSALRDRRASQVVTRH